MSEPRGMESADWAALWRRFQALDRIERDQAMDDADLTLDLTAYADGRLSEIAAEPVEAWLALHPETLDDVIAARGPRDATVPQRVIDRAASLVAGNSSDGGVIAFYPSPAFRSWRVQVVRVAVAACLLLTGLAGFTLGAGAYDNLLSSTSASGDTVDQPTSFFSTEDAAI